MRLLTFTIRRYFTLITLIIILLFWSFISSLEAFIRSYLLNLTHNNCTINSNIELIPLHTNDDYASHLSHDILLVVRTSRGTQSLRMPGILNTWFRFSPHTTYITTNGDVNFFAKYIPNNYRSHIHTTNCHQAHSIRDLCCHSASEFEIFFKHQNRYNWLCRFDDDQYVNVPLLANYLKQYEPKKEKLYIGKPSLKAPKRGRGIEFWFGTYGAGVCFSKSLLQLIYKDIQPNTKFMEGCIATNYPDDTHIAFILRKKYNINLTIANDFHHHIEGDLFTNITNPSNIDRVITFGFKGSNIPRFYPIIGNDQFRIRTLHCLLYPDQKCTRLIRILLNKFYKEKYG